MTKSISPAEPAEPAEPAARRLGPRLAFILAAGVIGVCLAASAAPSPLYKLYQATWHFSTPIVTLIYAVYCFGVLAALLLFGRISDAFGRRPVILAGMAGLLVSMVVFMLASSVAWLFVARSLQGLATGIAIGAAGTALLELHPSGNPAKAGLTNTIASSLGIGGGGLFGAVVVQYAPGPLVFPFAVLAALIVLLILGATVMPETAPDHGRTGFRLARPGVPRQIRAPFVLSGLGITASWSNVGLYLALVPTLAPTLLNSKSYLAAGVAIFALGVASAIAPALGQRLIPPALIVLGMAALVVGIGLMMLSLVTNGAALFILASLVIGTGVGLGMVGSLRLLGAVAPPDHRASVMASFYIVAYAAISIPAVAAGFVVLGLGAVHTFQVFGLGIAAVSLGTLLLATARRRGPLRRAHRRAPVAVSVPAGKAQ